MEEALREIGELAEAALPDGVHGWHISHGELTIDGERSNIVKLLTFLRDNSSC